MSSPAASAPGATWPAWAEAAAPKILYGVKLASAVALALLIAFYLELDNPSWAGTSAGIVCQPVLGASLRKGFFRMVGTVVGATATVALFGLFPQDRVGFLVGMALWCAACSFGNTLTRNFSAYAFALSGYTMAIVAGDAIADPAQAFHLSITRGAEIIIGIGCAMAVTGLSEVGGSRAKLAAAVDGLGREILGRFGDLLDDPAHQLAEGPDARRALVARVAALDPVIDQAIGEEPELRQRAAILHDAVSGLFAALSGWRIAESHLVHLPEGEARRRARRVAERLPGAWHDLTPVAAGAAAAASVEPGPDDAAARRDHPERRRTDRDGEPAEAPSGDAGSGRAEGTLAAARALAALKADGGVSRRLLADAAARLALGLGAAANGLALLRDPARARDPAHAPGFVVADYLPAVVNAIRTFVSICAALAFWILTEWPSGLGAVTFIAVTVLLMAPQQEKSAKAAFGFGLGTIFTACAAGVVDFALLPNQEGFLALAAILACFLVPMAALSTVPAFAPYFVAATMNFVPLVGPSNLMGFSTLSFYNSALGIVGGCLAGALALVLIPPVPREMRAERLVALTLRDLRRIAAGRWSPTPDLWQHRSYARLVAMPDGVDARHSSRLVAALSTGLQVLRLRSLAGPGEDGDCLRAALCGLAVRDVDGMLAGLDAADVAMRAGPRPDLRAPTAIQVIRDVVRQHRHEFEGA